MAIRIWLSPTVATIQSRSFWAMAMALSSHKRYLRVTALSLLWMGAYVTAAEMTDTVRVMISQLLTVVRRCADRIIAIIWEVSMCYLVTEMVLSNLPSIFRSHPAQVLLPLETS